MIQFTVKVMMAEEMSRRLGYTITYLSPRLATLKQDWEIIEESNMSSSWTKRRLSKIFNLWFKK
jgi:hypothetical protein